MSVNHVDAACIVRWVQFLEKHAAPPETAHDFYATHWAVRCNLTQRGG